MKQFLAWLGVLSIAPQNKLQEQASISSDRGRPFPCKYAVVQDDTSLLTRFCLNLYHSLCDLSLAEGHIKILIVERVWCSSNADPVHSDEWNYIEPKNQS